MNVPSSAGPRHQRQMGALAFGDVALEILAVVTTDPTAADRRTTKVRRLAWITPLLALSLSASAAPALVEADWRSTLVGGLAFYVGMTAGAAWQAINRSDVVDRFFNWSLLFAAVMLLQLFAGGGDEWAEGAWTAPGIVVGVVLAEGWMRQKHQQ